MSEVAAINHSVQVAGESQDHAFQWHVVVWQNGTMTTLASLSGSSEATAINDHNQIVGYSTTKTGSQHAVLWTLKPGS